jgi:hypothetical protein
VLSQWYCLWSVSLTCMAVCEELLFGGVLCILRLASYSAQANAILRL